jgi:hypothetical protein
MRDAFKAFAGPAVLLALVVAVSWFHAAAPCSAFGWMPAHDVPARCAAWVHH